MAPERTTSRDVARLAGVSQSTVSYVLTGKGSISPQTRARVLAAADELRYRPNLAARSMRTRRTGRVAVVLSIRDHNPVHLLAGAGAVAEAAGLAMEVHGVDGPTSARVHELAASGQFEGVLSFAPVLQPETADVPVVSSVHFDDEMHAAGELADASAVVAFVERLAGLGHTRFLHVAGPSHYASARARAAAYTATVSRLGLESLGVVGGSWTGAAGLDAIRALPADAPPLAVVAANDLVAVGVLRGVAERGWTVPGDVSVTGWDDYDVAELLTPSLTTVATDRTEAGRRAMRRLVAALRGTPVPDDETPLNRVVWRESTGAPVRT